MLHIYDDPESSFERSFERNQVPWTQAQASVNEDFSLAPRQLSLEKEAQQQQEEESVLESSVFGNLIESDLHHHNSAGTDCSQPPLYSPDILKQSQLERVFSKAASVMKKHEAQQQPRGNRSAMSVATSSRGSYTSQSKTDDDDDGSTDDFTGFDSESVLNSILDASTIYSHRSYTSNDEDDDDVDDDTDSKSLTSFLSSKGPSTGPSFRGEQDDKKRETKNANAKESAVISSSTLPSSSPALISIQVQQELTALQRQKQLSQNMFRNATQGLQDDFDRAHTLVETLEEQLQRAHQQRTEAFERLQGANLKREHQLQADAVRMLHLEIVQHCFSTEATRNMISAPMEGTAGNNQSFVDGLVGTSLNMSILDKVMRLSMPAAVDECAYISPTSSSSLASTMYGDLSVEELQLIRTRLQAILELFGTAQRRRESTNLRWQAQADVMKQDAASKYILYCRYGQI